MRCCAQFGCLLGIVAAAACAASAESAAPKPFDTHTRIPWTTSHIAGRPDPPLPFRLRRVFERLPLKEPVFLTHVPGGDQLLVVERLGRILIFENRPDAESGGAFLDVGEETYSLTFHPRFAENRYVYVFSNGPRDAQVKRNRIALRGQPRAAGGVRSGHGARDPRI